MIKTAKMKEFLGKTLFVITFIIMSSCATDRYKIDGKLIKVDGKYYRLNNTMGNAYILEPVHMDTIFVIK